MPRLIALEDVLCPIEGRVVGQDWCVTYDRRLVQIQKKHQALSLAGKQVDVLQRADGTLKVMYQGQPLLSAELASRPAQALLPRPAPVIHTPQRPAPGHPWNQSYKRMGRHAAGSTQ